MWWKAKREARAELKERMNRVHELERSPEPTYGRAPHWQAVLDGRREFAGSVESGPWVGHEVFVIVWGSAAIDRIYEPANFLWSADYWRTDFDAPGADEGETVANVVTLDEVYEFLGGEVVAWYSPLRSLERVGLMFGGDGRNTPN